MVPVEVQRDDDHARGLLVGAGTGRVEGVLEAPRPVGEVAQRGAHAPLPVVEDLVEGGDGAELGDDPGQPLDRDHVGASLRGEVAAPLVGTRELATSSSTTSAVIGTAGTRRPSWYDLGRVGGHGAGRHPAQVGVVGPVGDPADEVAVDVDGGDEGDVVEVGAARERVVEHPLPIGGGSGPAAVTAARTAAGIDPRWTGMASAWTSQLARRG